MRQAPTWYSVTVEIGDGDAWRPLDRPCAQVWECDAEEVAEETAEAYDLADVHEPWRVRVYSGYNRYDDLLFDMLGGVPAGGCGVTEPGQAARPSVRR